jgi:hypothetical protein
VSVTQWLDELLAIAGDVAVRDDGRRKLRHFRNRLASFTHAAEMDPPTRMERGHIAALLHALADRCYPPPMSYDDKYGNDTRLRGGVASDESD